MQPQKNLENLRFGSFVVLEYAGFRIANRYCGEPTKGKHFWKLRCFCGLIREVQENLLPSKVINYCRHKNPGPVEAPRSANRQKRRYTKPSRVPKVYIEVPKPFFEVVARDRSLKTLFRGYKASAKSRNLDWGLTYERFVELVSSPCHYSGVPPRGLIRQRFHWNGIDRVDSSKGYLPNNVVPCSSFANYAKKDSSYETFIEWLDQVANYRSIENVFQEGTSQDRKEGRSLEEVCGSDPRKFQ
jgi:hypothetical protein